MLGLQATAARRLSKERIRMQVLLRSIAFAVALSCLTGAGAALAGYGQPSDWQLNFQDPATPVMAWIVWFHNYLLWVIAAITAFVLALLLIVMVRFNSRANPTPTHTTHSTPLEIAWTVVPVVILLCIAVPSFRLLYYQQVVPQADLTIKATGKP